MYKNRIDNLDKQILQILQKDARKSAREIARQLHRATGTVATRIKKLTESGIIKGYSAILDPSKLGYGLTAIILIQAEGKHLVEVENEIARAKEVVAVYDITGEFDAAVIARFRDRKSLNKFVKSIIAMPYVKRTVTSLVLNVVKEDTRVYV
jgi:DNA-binding Lrp family transcriptional regulator